MTRSFHIGIADNCLAFPSPPDKKKPYDSSSKLVDITDTYPVLLRSHLEAAMPARDIVVSNIGSFYTTGNPATQKMKDIIEWLQLDVVVLNHGIVDLLESASDKEPQSVAEFEKHVARSIGEHRETTPEIMLIVFAFLPINQQNLDKFPRQNEMITAHNEILRRYATEHDVLFVDINEQDATLAEQSLDEDGIHLSRTGHRLYADQILQSLESVFGVPRGYKGMDFHGSEGPATMREIDTLIRNGEITKALEALETFERAEGDTGRGRYAIGRFHHQMGDSVRAFRSLVLLDNEDGVKLGAMNFLGISAFSALEPADALPFLQKAYSLDPTARAIIFRLGKAMERIGYYGPALKIYDQFLTTVKDEEIRVMRNRLATRMNVEVA